MLVTKVIENVEYYVITNVKNKDAFVYNKENKVVKIKLPPIKPINKDYIFIYVGDLRAHYKHDYTIKNNIIVFKTPMNATNQIIVKVYTKHENTQKEVNFII